MCFFGRCVVSYLHQATRSVASCHVMFVVLSIGSGFRLLAVQTEVSQVTAMHNGITAKSTYAGGPFPAWDSSRAVA